MSILTTIARGPPVHFTGGPSCCFLELLCSVRQFGNVWLLISCVTCRRLRAASIVCCVPISGAGGVVAALVLRIGRVFRTSVTFGDGGVITLRDGGIIGGVITLRNSGVIGGVITLRDGGVIGGVITLGDGSVIGAAATLGNGGVIRTVFALGNGCISFSTVFGNRGI